MPVRRIVILAFEQTELIDVAGPSETFATAAALADPQAPPYKVEIAAPQRGLIRTSSGIAIEPHLALDDVGDPDTFLVAGGGGIHKLCADAGIVALMRKLATRVRRIGAVCTGAMLLAEAGLLDGRRAATHWNWCDRIAARYPQVTIEPDPIFVVDGNVWTSAGMTAGIDLALAMVEADLGPALALRTAQEMVVFRKRPGGQSQFSVELAIEATTHQPLAALQQWIADHPSADLSVDVLAARMAMSPRNFSRLFRRETGATPARFVERVRLQKARALLETTHDPVGRIAHLCGFGSADVMTRAMIRRLGAGPTDYRTRFNASAALREEQHALS